jgi:chorismate synthase
MSHNTFGHLFRVTTFGESHGPALGCVIDGCPPGIALTEADIQRDLDRRRPGQSKYTTQRREADQVRILSGVFQDERMRAPLTTGTPIALLIENTDARSKDYSEIREKFRPGHADYTYLAKYGLRDYRGGGRSSARETAARVAAGAVARKVLGYVLGPVIIRGALVQMGKLKIKRKNWDWEETARNPFFSPDAESVKEWAAYLDDLRKSGSSCGAIVEVVAENLPAGLGAPIYGKLDGDLAAAMMSINAVKGVEIGNGFAAAALTGEQNADEMRAPSPLPKGEGSRVRGKSSKGANSPLPAGEGPGVRENTIAHNSPLPAGEGPGVRAIYVSENKWTRFVKRSPHPNPLPQGEGT